MMVFCFVLFCAFSSLYLAELHLRDPMTLHSRVDARRDARFGPAVTFATHLIELLVHTVQCRVLHDTSALQHPAH